MGIHTFTVILDFTCQEVLIITIKAERRTKDIIIMCYTKGN